MTSFGSDVATGVQGRSLPFAIRYNFPVSTLDFGRQSNDYATHRRGFPQTFYERLERMIPLRGLHVLDLATGPGTIALELAARGCSVVGIDVSAGQIEMAGKLAKQRGLESATQFVLGRAEATGLGESQFDLASAGSCWHWFDSSAVLEELHRVLRPGAHLVIAHDCYLARHSVVARDSEKLILELNPAWPMAGEDGIFPEEIDQVINGGFSLVEAFAYDHDEEFTHERWRGRMRACNGVLSMSPSDAHCFDEALGDVLRRNHPDPVTIPHRVWCVIARKTA